MMTGKRMKQAAWFAGAWAFVMCGLVGMAWVFDTPSGAMTSWRFFSMYAVIFTFGPLAAFCANKGMSA